ncbi:MAG: hypothetical protein HZB18_16280 [Chloroflexi bacterium]|nr:hypothetical protein [Chloroflexota bacterium]
MDQTNTPLHSQQDDQLADFADQVLKGKMKYPASPPTDTLPGLEETILRLSSSFPPNPLDDAAVKQMHVRLKARIRREEQSAKPSFWKKWFGRDVSPQLGLAFAVLAILVVVVISAPSLTTSGSSTAGTASAPVNIFIAGGLLLMVAIAFWVSRRK